MSILLSGARFSESEDSQDIEIVLCFSNDRYQAIGLKKGDTPKRVARALIEMAARIERDEHLKDSN